MKKLEIMFSCTNCGLVDHKMEVDVRLPDQDVEDWMDKVPYSIKDEHTKISPNCKATRISEIKIPLSETGVGFLP